MANAIKYITKRDGVYQYQRRVPEDIVRDAEAYKAYFGSRTIFRQSLHTKSPDDVHMRAEAVRLDFENLLAEARGQSVAVPVKHIAVVKPKPPLRKITAEYLAQVKSDFIARTIRPWARHI